MNCRKFKPLRRSSFPPSTRNFLDPMKHAFKLLAAVALLSTSLSALAGKFNTDCYSSSACSDVAAPIVTDEFTKTYPAKKWSLFVQSSVISLGQQVVCMATVGVVPVGTGQAPGKRYSAVQLVNDAKTSFTPGEQAEYESICVRIAVASMMSDVPKNMYVPNSLVRK